MLKSPTDESGCFVSDEELFEREIEAEICQRFIRMSCEKMLRSRQERGGAKLHRNLLLLQLVRKARNDSTRLPYECSSLLKRSPHFASPPQSKTSSLLRFRRDSTAMEDDEESSSDEDEFEDEREHETKTTTALSGFFDTSDDDEYIDDEPSLTTGGLDFGAGNVEDEDEEIDVLTCDDRDVAPTPLPSLSSLLPQPMAEEQQRELSPPLKLSSNIFEAFAPPPPALEPLEYSVQDNEQTVFKFSTSFGFRSGHHSSPTFSSPALLLAGAAQEDAIEEGQDVAASLFDLDDFLPRKVPELDADEEQHQLLLDQPVSPPWPADLHHHDDAASDPLKPAALFDVVFFMEDPAKPAADAVQDDNDEEDKPPQLFAASPDASDECDETDGHFVNGMQGRKRLALGELVGDVAEKRPCCEDDDEAGDAIEPKTGTLKTGSADSGIDVEAGLAGEDNAPVDGVEHGNDQTVPALTGPVRRVQSMPLVCK